MKELMTAMTSTTTEEFLRQRPEAILGELIELVERAGLDKPSEAGRHKLQAESLVREFRSLREIRPPAGTRFAKMKDGIRPVLTVLDERGPLSRDDLQQIIAGEGFPHPEILNYTISSLLVRPGKPKKRFKENRLKEVIVQGRPLIGRYDWDDARFIASSPQ